MHKSIFFFIGTTAELIKVAPIIKELQKRKIKFKVITSGQNKIRFEDLKDYIGPIKPEITFNEKVNKSSVFHFIIWAIRTFLTGLITLRKEFKALNKNNSYFVIQGDTVTSSIGAILTKVYGIKLVLIEAGDLTSSLFEPFPEQICRHINIRLADILFPPNDWAKNNLKFVKGIKINTKQNTLVESFRWTIKTRPITKNLKRFKKYYLLIMHRQEHVIFRKNWTKRILKFIIQHADKNLTCLLLNHPLAIQIINSLKLVKGKNKNNKTIIISPLPYPDFMTLMRGAEFIATDSAFNQLEAYLMGKPYLGLRDVTEQIEGLGKNVVICKGDKKIIKEFLMNYKKYKSKPIELKDDQRPSKIIVDYLTTH